MSVGRYIVFGWLDLSPVVGEICVCLCRDWMMGIGWKLLDGPYNGKIFDGTILDWMISVGCWMGWVPIQSVDWLIGSVGLILIMGIGWNMLVGTLSDGMLSGGTIRNGMILDGMGSSFNISGLWTDWLDWLASPLCYLTAALSTHLPTWLTHLLSRFAELRNKQNQVKIQISLFSCISTRRWKKAQIQPHHISNISQ